MSRTSPATRRELRGVHLLLLANPLLRSAENLGEAQPVDRDRCARHWRGAAGRSPRAQRARDGFCRISFSSV